MIAYKIFDLRNNAPHTLFHGINGSRKVAIGEWLDAEPKMVRDGSGRVRYMSGFHAYATLDDVKAWAQGAKNLDNRVVVQVQLKDCRDKPHAIRKTILASRMRLLQEDWTNRRPLKGIA